MNSYGVRPFDGLQPAAEIVGADEVGEVGFELLAAVVMVALDGASLIVRVHAFHLPVIRHVIFGAYSSCCSSFGTAFGEPIRDVGHHRAFAEAVAWGTAGSDGWVVSTCGALCWQRSPQAVAE